VFLRHCRDEGASPSPLAGEGGEIEGSEIEGVIHLICAHAQPRTPTVSSAVTTLLILNMAFSSWETLSLWRTLRTHWPQPDKKFSQLVQCPAITESRRTEPSLAYGSKTWKPHPMSRPTDPSAVSPQFRQASQAILSPRIIKIAANLTRCNDRSWVTSSHRQSSRTAAIVCDKRPN
jgi:hypothetical protein